MSKIWDKIKKTLCREFDKDYPLSAIDVGAYLANSDIEVLEKFPNATIHVIEACPYNFEELEKACESHDGLIPHHLAITDQDGEETIYVSSNPRNPKTETSQSNSLYKEFIGGKRWARPRGVKVKGSTIDSFCKENNIDNLDYLKINCEGCEYKIFGSDDHLDFLDKITFLEVDWHTKCSRFMSRSFVVERQRIVGMLRDKGFRMVLGNKDLGSSKNINQFWRRDGVTQERI